MFDPMVIVTSVVAYFQKNPVHIFLLLFIVYRYQLSPPATPGAVALPCRCAPGPVRALTGKFMLPPPAWPARPPSRPGSTRYWHVASGIPPICTARQI
jgi:hypothetical protein